MAYVDNQGIRIHYEIQGKGLPLVLHHGSASSLQQWYERGYVELLKSHYQLILVDARGHGHSDKPHDKASYALSLRVSDVVAVLDKLGIEKAHYWGYSMGGWIGFGMAKYAPMRIHSLILGGAHPYADSAQAFNGIDGTQPKALVEAMESFVGLRFTELDKEQILENDLVALAAAMHERDSLEDILPSMKMPCFLFVGENDPRISKIALCAKQIPNATFLSIPGLNHATASIRSDLILPDIEKFLQAFSEKRTLN